MKLCKKAIFDLIPKKEGIICLKELYKIGVKFKNQIRLVKRYAPIHLTAKELNIK